MYDDRPKREPSRWFLNNVSDEVERCVRAVRVQMKREMPSYATPDDYVLAHLFVAHELMAETWQSINSVGNKERTFKLAEAMADVAQVLVDLTHRPEDDLSGKREIERRRSKIKGSS